MQKLTDPANKHRTILERIVSTTLISATSICGGYCLKDFAPRPATPPARLSGLGELKLPTSDFPRNLNQILEEYPGVSVRSIHAGHDRMTIRFRE